MGYHENIVVGNFQGCLATLIFVGKELPRSNLGGFDFHGCLPAVPCASHVEAVLELRLIAKTTY